MGTTVSPRFGVRTRRARKSTILTPSLRTPHACRRGFAVSVSGEAVEPRRQISPPVSPQLCEMAAPGAHRPSRFVAHGQPLVPRPVGLVGFAACDHAASGY
jgi:hypothetical protein